MNKENRPSMRTIRARQRRSLPWARFCVLVLLLWALGGCAGQGKGPEALETLSIDSTTETGPGGQQPAYRLQHGDILEISLYTTPASPDGGPRNDARQLQFILGPGQTMAVKFVQAPELNETQIIRPDGTISLPYLGQYSVQGKTILQVEEELKAFYSQELKKPDLYITIPKFNSILEELDSHHFEIPVRPDGYISIPLLGDIRASGRTIDELKEEINKNLHDVMAGISAAVGLKRGRPAAIFVIGAVRAPGRYPVDRPLAGLQALALAGGRTGAAREDMLLVLRQDGGTIRTMQLDGNGLFLRKDRPELFLLQPGDTLLVPAQAVQ